MYVYIISYDIRRSDLLKSVTLNIAVIGFAGFLLNQGESAGIHVLVSGDLSFNDVGSLSVIDSVSALFPFFRSVLVITSSNFNGNLVV